MGIAQAQVNYPDLLILDEPAALDPMGRRDVLEVMARLRKHTTIFYSTHILDDVQRVSDSVAILNHGQLIAQAPTELLQEVVLTFLPLAVGAVGMGTVIVVQGAIVGEKQLGTAAWVMSKPASRAAFILTKALSYTIGFWTTAIIVPSIIFVIVTRQIVPAPLALMPFQAGLAVWALAQLFYLMLTLMLGTLFDSRGPIAGIGIAFIMAGLLLKGFIPQAIMMFTPWYLPDISAGLTLQMPLPGIWPIPLVATGCWLVLFTAVALWRFAREEF